MGIITEIKVQEKRKNRCNVYIDNEFSFGISNENAIKNHLKKDMVLTEQDIERIKNTDEYENALSKAVNFISKTLKTKMQVVNYLRNKGFEDEIVFRVVDKLKEYKYIDDIEYAKKYLEFSSKKQGEKLSNYKLMAKGIKKEDIEKANNESEIVYAVACENVLEKYLRNKEKTKENIIKAQRYLLGKGFSYEDIESAISKIKVDNGENFNS